MAEDRFGFPVSEAGSEFAIFHSRFPDLVWAGPTKDRKQMELWLEEAKEDFMNPELFVIKQRTITDWS